MALKRDPTKSRAVIAVSLLLLAVFVAMEVTDFDLGGLLALYPYALVNALETLPSNPGSLDAWFSLATVFTSILVHADLMHLGNNLLFFWLFGTLLSQVAGDRFVLVAIVVCSMTAAAAFVIHHGAGSRIPVVGASGAITGVAGLYMLLAFRWDIPWAMAWPLARPVPALHAGIMALIMVGIDLYALRQGGADGIAQDAHIGGFAGGAIVGALLTTFYPTWEGFRASRWGRGVHGP